jgi:hypothetical protein
MENEIERFCHMDWIGGGEGLEQFLSICDTQKILKSKISGKSSLQPMSCLDIKWRDSKKVVRHWDSKDRKHIEF